jgi:hypothetical protein
MGVANIELLRRQHEFFKASHQRMVRDELRYTGEFALQHVQSTPHFKPRTGALQKATKFSVAMGGGGGRLKLYNNKPYAAAIDKGARPHPITGKPLLVFYWAKIGAWVSLHKVNHPGNKPYSFLHDAWARSADHFLERMVPRMAALAARF